jgi:putative (di)nucleoside polyphosphate hydrolase
MTRDAQPWRTDVDSPLPYRVGVGVMLISRDGRVFIGRRINQETEAWQMPQGGIDPGETAEQAARRELHEEVGTDKAALLAESAAWLTYDLPEPLVGRALRGRYRGQRQKWFAFRFEGEDKDINLAASPHPEFDAWRWVASECLPTLIVPFKRAVYQALLEEFRSLVRPSA